MSSVLGIMSGTSIDGVDYALCEISERCVKLRRHCHVPFPKSLRQRLHLAAANRSTTYALGQLHHDLGRFYATGARRLLVGRASSRAAPLAPALKCVGLHGQTVFHDANARATLQIGEPAWLAADLGVPVVSNFRAADIAAGGQGAPLATMFHEWVFAERGTHVCVNNLGGISNVTSLDWRRGTQPRITAFDTGPANILMDMAVTRLTGGRKTSDTDGKWASRGTAHKALLANWLKHPFFRQNPPKSTGREVFGEIFLERVLREAKGLSRFDLLATLTEFTARSIALNYSLHLPDTIQRVILCGGGASNPAFVEAIRRNMTYEVISCGSLGWPVQAIEPAAFAVLAWLRMNGLPGNIPGTTGAKSSVLLGQITQLKR